MSVVKVIELVGTSSESWENAVQAALDDANKTIQNIESIDVTNLSVIVQDGKVTEWQADTRIAFRIEDRLRSDRHEGHEHHEKASL